MKRNIVTIKVPRRKRPIRLSTKSAKFDTLMAIVCATVNAFRKDHYITVNGLNHYIAQHDARYGHIDKEANKYVRLYNKYYLEAVRYVLAMKIQQLIAQGLVQRVRRGVYTIPDWTKKVLIVHKGKLIEAHTKINQQGFHAKLVALAEQLSYVDKVETPITVKRNEGNLQSAATIKPKSVAKDILTAMVMLARNSNDPVTPRDIAKECISYPNTYSKITKLIQKYKAKKVRNTRRLHTIDRGLRELIKMGLVERVARGKYTFVDTNALQELAFTKEAAPNSSKDISTPTAPIPVQQSFDDLPTVVNNTVALDNLEEVVVNALNKFIDKKVIEITVNIRFKE